MTSKRQRAQRSTTPPAVKTMGVSEFVRGGIYSISEPTTVMSHSEELGTWYPRGQGVIAAYYGATESFDLGNTTPTLNVRSMTGSTVAATSPPNVDALTAAIEQMHTYLTSQTKSNPEESK